MARKHKNIIDVADTRQFLWRAYGFKTKEITEYQLLILHEELRARFDWYHTSGKLMVALCDTSSGRTEVDYHDLGKYTDPEDVAIKINRYVMNLLQHADCPYYREPRPKHDPTAFARAIKEHHESNTRTAEAIARF